MKSPKLIHKPLLFVHQGYELYGSDKMLLLNIKAAGIKYPDKKIFVVLPKKGILSDRLEKDYNVEVLIRQLGVVRKYDLKHFNFSAFIRIFTFFRLIAFINSFEFVYINSIVIIDYILAARFAKIKVFIHVHELPYGFASTIFSKLLNFSKASLIFVSEASRNSFKKLKNNHQTVIWNGVIPVKELYTETDIHDQIKLLLIGRINKWKGQSLLIKAISLLNEMEKAKVSVKIVGDVFANQQYLKENLIHEIDLNRLHNTIELHSFTSQPENYYNWADVIIVPSIKPEPFGLVAIEAMSIGKLVIAANHGGLSEIIKDNFSGILFKPGSEKDLTEKISNLIKNKYLITEIGQNGLRVFNENFKESIYIKKLNEII